MCKEHDAMIPPAIKQVIEHSRSELANILLHQRPEADRQEVLSANRQARALAFASVCEQLGIDVDALFRKAVGGALDGL